MDDLRGRKDRFDALTGPGSAFESAREQLAHRCGSPDLDRLCQEFGVIRGEQGRLAKMFADSDFVRDAEIRRRPRYVVAGISTLRGCEKKGLAPSANGENPGKTAFAKVPVPIFSQPLPSRQASPEFLTFLTGIGPKSIADAAWVRINLQSLTTITEWYRNQQDSEFDPPDTAEAIRQFSDATWQVWRESDRDHLLAAHLLLR
jgi:hypothetical protein